MSTIQITKDDVKERAREWAEANEPHNCLNENCPAVNKWKLGEVGEMNSYQYNKKERHGEVDSNAPVKFVVPVVCSLCGRDIKHYEE